MSAADSFVNFNTLPTELRLRIWEQALSVRSVWAALRRYDGEGLPFLKYYIGLAPYLAGLSYKEAWRLLEQSYAVPLRGPFMGSPATAGSYWVDLETTVVYLGDFTDASIVVNCFGRDESSKFKHVGLVLHDYNQLTRTCQRLANLCLALRTIIIQRGVTERGTDWHPDQNLSLGTAAFWATIPEYTGPELGSEQLDAAHLRSLVLEYFSKSPPRIHLLAPDATHYPT